METNISNNSEEKITRVTNILTKIFRICFFLIIAPFAIAFAGFWILVQFLYTFLYLRYSSFTKALINIEADLFS
jgi:hypothetical protein